MYLHGARTKVLVGRFVLAILVIICQFLILYALSDVSRPKVAITLLNGEFPASEYQFNIIPFIFPELSNPTL
jgi:hypothetical protein